MKINLIVALLALSSLQSVMARPLDGAAFPLIAGSPRIAGAPLKAGTSETPLAVADAPLEFVLSVQKIILVNGKEQRVAATAAEPGDVLEYRAEYKNVGKITLNTLLLTLPLPQKTSFIAGSAQPVDMMLSTRAAPDVFKPAVTPDAKPRPDYGALRWAIDALPAGKTVLVSARVRVDGRVLPIAQPSTTKPDVSSHKK